MYFIITSFSLLGKVPVLHYVLVSLLVCCLQSMSLDSLVLDKQSLCPAFSRVIHIQVAKQTVSVR